MNLDKFSDLARLDPIFNSVLYPRASAENFPGGGRQRKKDQN